MSLHTEWKAIAARIEGFLRSTGTFSQLLAVNSDDPFATASAILLPEAKGIFEELRQLAQRHEGTLPTAAQEALCRFLEDNKAYFDSAATGAKSREVIKRVATALSSVCAETSFHLTDFAATARRLSERAFIHLQRAIVVNEAVRAAWERAFSEGEVSCEKLGAVHLLAHGIWAFKVNAAGERTDLVFSDRPPDETEAERAAEALVLTEWKVVAEPADALARAEQACSQADLYSGGSLAGIELASYRYLILISRQNLEPIPDRRQGDVTYRHNIAVAPQVPSKVSRTVRRANALSATSPPKRASGGRLASPAIRDSGSA